MKKSIIFSTLIALLVLGGCFHISKMEMTSARNSNVCKKLKGEVLLYAIFVDTKAGGDWGHFEELLGYFKAF